jgi:hypothetical protein
MENELNSADLLKQLYGLTVPIIRALANLQTGTAELLASKNPALANQLKTDAAELNSRIKSLQQAAGRGIQSKNKAQE